ncbi:MAG: hypothetical protein ABSE28_03720 [Candidatus Sulfotelmatobacter sp.]|jgi:hypothetical protein
MASRMGAQPEQQSAGQGSAVPKRESHGAADRESGSGPLHPPLMLD